MLSRTLVLLMIFAASTTNVRAGDGSEALWEQFFKDSTPGREVYTSSKNGTLLRHIAAVYSLDPFLNPELHQDLFRRMAERLLMALHHLRASDMRRADGKAASAGWLKGLYEAIGKLAPYCSKEYISELTAIAEVSRDGRISAMSLELIKTLATRNPQEFSAELNNSDLSTRLTSIAEAQRLDFGNRSKSKPTHLVREDQSKVDSLSEFIDFINSFASQCGGAFRQ